MTNIFNALNLFALAKRIGRPLILDGALGSVLRKSSFPQTSLWASQANISAPEKVLALHKQYIKAGADIITTNTFRTNPVAFADYNGKYDYKKLIKQSVSLAQKAAESYPIIIAGSNPPAEDCYKKERSISSKLLRLNHHTHINLLMDSGAFFILNETQSHFDEISIICKYCSKNNIPFVVSLFFDDNLNILSGEKVSEVLKFIMDYAPLAISFNCIKPGMLLKLSGKLKLKDNWGAYLNCGTGAYSDDKITGRITPDEYLNIIKSILPLSPSFIGGCCGSTPAHIKLIKEYLDGKHNN